MKTTVSASGMPGAYAPASYRRDMLFTRRKAELPAAESALPGRDTPIDPGDRHRVLGTPLTPPFPDGMERIVVGMGCFWGADGRF